MASIEKRVRNGRKTWRAHYRTPAGAQRSKSFARKIDAERFLAGVENSKVIGSYVDPMLAKVTVGAWAQQWLDGQEHLKPTTRSRYEGIVRKHIHPTWDRVTLANVSHGDVQAWVTGLSKRHSPATVHKIHRVLSLVLDMAVKDGRLARNVAPASTSRERTRTSTAISPTTRSKTLPMPPGTPPTRASTVVSTPGRTRPIDSWCSSWPTPESASARWPHSASAGSTCVDIEQ